ncbi:MAG: MgtC/SapB family protein, partial [Nanoarchaeota archaeon]|nr:MgtC/SapB family protein [Nanoarchaeota archaeon]
MDFSIFLNFLVAVGLGALVGMEREFEIQKLNKVDFAGLRTFVLISLLGAVSAYLSTVVFGSYTFFFIAFICLTILMVASLVSLIFETKERDFTITTEIAAFLTFCLGAMCILGHMMAAVILTILVFVFLTLRKNVHEFVQKIHVDEVYATLKFAVITLLILPFLPNVNYTPMDIPVLGRIIEVAPFLSVEIAQRLDVFNPFKIWLMVVLISGISFVGYILIRTIGAGKGLGLTGFLGGLVSSTAVTSSMSVESKKLERIIYPLVLAVIVACSTMFVRVFIEILFVNAGMLKYAAVPLLVMGISGFVAAFLVWQKITKEHTKSVEFKESPFTLGPALKFAVFFGFVLLVSKFGYILFGTKGIFIAALLAGLADVDAITLSMATLAATGDISALIATVAVTIAVATNTVVKAGITHFFGARAFSRKVMTILGIVLGLGLLSLVFFL